MVQVQYSHGILVQSAISFEQSLYNKYVFCILWNFLHPYCMKQLQWSNGKFWHGFVWKSLNNKVQKSWYLLTSPSCFITSKFEWWILGSIIHLCHSLATFTKATDTDPEGILQFGLDLIIDYGALVFTKPIFSAYSSIWSQVSSWLRPWGHYSPHQYIWLWRISQG